MDQRNAPAEKLYKISTKESMKKHMIMNATQHILQIKTWTSLI